MAKRFIHVAVGSRNVQFKEFERTIFAPEFPLRVAGGLVPSNAESEEADALFEQLGGFKGEFL